MKRKRIWILLMISLVMIMTIGAIAAADTNDTLQEEGSDANIAATPVAFEEEDNAASPVSENGSDDEISADDNQDELSKGGASSNLNNGVLSSSNDNSLRASENCFYWVEHTSGNGWYEDLRDAIDAVKSSGSHGTIRVNGGEYTERDATTTGDIEIHFKSAVDVTIEKDPGATKDVVFNGGSSTYLFWLHDTGCKFTFKDITFKNGKATEDGGAFQVTDGQLTLVNCKLEGNHAGDLGGAIYVKGGTLVARNCQFTGNSADNKGGAICCNGGSAELINCYFDNNKAASLKNDFDDYDDAGSWSFSDCTFKGDGSIDVDVDNLTKSVTVTPDIDDDVNYAVLYKDGSEYDRKSCNDGDHVTFEDLERGSYTVYMMKNWEKRYIYSDTSFTIIEPNFVLNDNQVFETLSEAVNAISAGGTGTITVADGTWTGSSNLNIQIINKIVTIRPKIESSDSVIFSGSSQSYFLYIRDNSQLTIEDITITGKFSDSALKFSTAQVCTISECEFKNIVNSNNQPGNPINAENSNLVLDGCTFESNGAALFKNTAANIDDCTFTSNNGGQGGAINANPSSDLTITNSKFTSNVASEGGAIYTSNLKVSYTEFTGNYADLGGAVYITSRTDSLVNITNCVFDSNGGTYRNIYSESLTRKINLHSNEYDVDLKIVSKVASYGSEYILDGDFDWGSNLNNTYTFLTGMVDDENIFGDLLTVVDNKFEINVGVLPGGTHEFVMEGMYEQGDSNDHFYPGYSYYTDLYGNEFYLDEPAYAKASIEKANITLNLEVKDVLIPEVPVLNVYSNWNLNYTIFIGNKYYQLQVVNGKGSMQLTGLDLGNYTVAAMRDGDNDFNFVMNATTFSISKTYSNFLVLSTNVEYDTLSEAVANSNDEDTIFVKKGTYADTGITVSDKTLDIIALEGAVFDAQGGDANFIIVNKDAEVYISGITFRGLHNRNTNYGAIVNHGHLSLDSCNFTDNKITKTSFAQNGGAAVFNDGDSLDIDNCNFIGNAAPLKVSTAAVTSAGYEDVSITDSKFINNSAREGGAVHFTNMSQFEAAITSCEFDGNTAVRGSAIYVGNSSRYVTVTSSTFKKNDIKNNVGENNGLEGGVIYVNANTDEVTLDISLSNFEDNSNMNVDGGVICLDGISKASIETCTFNNNRGKDGSVILIKNPYNKKLFLAIDGSSFTNNRASTGAIATSPKVTAFIDECIFQNNTGESRHISSNGFTVTHDSIFDVKDVKLNAMSVQYGESSIINGTADTGTGLYAAADLTVAGENVLVEIKNNAFSYKTGILPHGKYYATLNAIVDTNNNTYLMDSITEIFRVRNVGFELDVSVDNITYGETIKVVEKLPQNATGTIDYQLNGKYYTKEEIESLILDAGKYTLVAIYDHEDYAFTYASADFEVYKANPTITVADVEVDYNDTLILNIETDVPSIYIIEIEDYRTAVFVNGSRAVEIENTFDPGNYTVRVTSQERVNYKSNFTVANLKVNRKLSLLMLRGSNRITSSDDVHIEVSAPDGAVGNVIYTVSDSNKNTVRTIIQSCMDDLVISGLDEGSYEINGVSEGDGQLLMTSNTLRFNVNNNRNSPEGNDLDEEEEEGKFIFQYDEDSDYEYYDTLEEAIDEAVTWGSGTIMVRGGTYSGDEFCGISIEGEVELTITAFEDEVVIFDCKNENYFLYLTYETEISWTETTPPIPYEEQTEGPTVTLQNITVINGYNSEGGAIEMDAGSLTLMNCNFSNCNADYGGAIYIGSAYADEDASLIGVNTTFTNNYATEEGGAIYISKSSLQDISVSFLLSTFLDNHQGEDEEYKMNYFGGYTDEIVRNSCIFNGEGEIYSVVIDKINQTVTINGTATDSFDLVVLMYFGQTPLYSIYNNGSHDFYLTFEDVMAGNYTVGIMNEHDYNTYIFRNSFEMKVPNFIISEDEVYENLTDAIDAVAENGIIYANANYHVEENMEIDIRKSFTLKNFRDRTVVFDGSGVNWFFTIAEGCTVEFDNLYFNDGAVKTRAAIENYGTLIINNCTFDSFETASVIYNSGLLNILKSEFTLNFVNDTLIWNDGDLVIDDVVFSDNVVISGSAVYNNGVAEIFNSNFTANSNGGNGGAIYNTNSLNIENTVFCENEAINGGAIYNSGTLRVLNSTFEDNTANGYGGVIYNENELNVFNSTFTGGCSENDGGAIYNNNIMAVDNSTFVANSATGRGGAIYNNKTLVLTKSFFGINFADEYANIYNAGDIQFSENIFDFYDVVLIVPDGEYGIPTIITGTLNPEFNMDLQVILPGFVNNQDAYVTISDGVFEYDTGILPKGHYDVVLNEVIYDSYSNIYYGKAISDMLIVNKATVYLNLTVDDVVLPGRPVLKISASQNGLIRILFNNKFTHINITDGQITLELDEVGEGNYSILVVREGNENYKDAANTTSFAVREYEGNFIVNSTSHQFDTLREALSDSSDDDIIYVREGIYTGADNIGLTISNKKLTIVSLGDVVFDASSTDLSLLTVDESSDVTINDVVITGFNHKNKIAVIDNKGSLTVDNCIFINNTINGNECKAIIYNTGNLNISESVFYGNVLMTDLIRSDSGLVNIEESAFVNNTLNQSSFAIININNANSAKITSNEFSKNQLSEGFVIKAEGSNVYVESEFYNNTAGLEAIYVSSSNLTVSNSTFADNILMDVIYSLNSPQSVISGSVFTNNAVNSVVLSKDKNLSVVSSVFSANKISEYSALTILEPMMNASVDGCVFSNNQANDYRNIYSLCDDLNISNSVFDAVNVDFSVYDIDYGQSETIGGSIDIGINLKFTVNLDINGKVYSVNVTDSQFTYNSGVINGGDYKVVLKPTDDNSNTFVFDKMTRIFTVNRVDPGLSISIADITEGEKLKVNMTIAKDTTARVVYELNGDTYNKNQLENLTLSHGNYLVIAMYRGDKNYLSAYSMVGVEVQKVAPNITVSDVVVNYTEKIKVNVSADVADYYTVFIGNESVSLYVDNSATFIFSSEALKPDIYEIMVYVFETDDYAEAYAYANLTVNRYAGVFNLSSDIIEYGENATISVEVPLNACGNITYRVYDGDNELVYNITQSCLEELVVPDLSAGSYTVTGTYEGDSYYSSDSTVTSGTIFVNNKGVGLNITVDDIIYGENATVYVESNVDGEYLVYVGKKQFIVTVLGGIGNVSVSDLGAGNYSVNVTIIDGNYSAVNETSFEVAPKEVSVVVSVEDIVYGEDAIVVVWGEIDGEYIVAVYDQNYTVTVSDGKGNTTIYDLDVDEDILVSVSIANGNYSAYDNTTFNVVPKEVPVVISVANIVYGERAVVIVEADVEGDYIITVRDVNYTVSVSGGYGVKYIYDLSAGENILASVSIADGNYSAYNTTTFNVAPKETSVVISVGNIVYGEDTVVVVESDVDGDYIVTIRDVNYTVSVSGGDGVTFIPNLSVGNQIAATVKRDDNYKAFNETTFNINPKQANVEVAAEDITYGENATVSIVAEIDGMYTLSVNDVEYPVEVIDGEASQVISGLTAGDYVVQIAIADGNYSASSRTAFNVAPKPVSLAVSVENIIYGEEAVVIVEAEIDGEYLVYVGDDPFTVTVTDGAGNVSVPDLSVGNYAVNVTALDGNYSAFDETSFEVAPKEILVVVSVEDIVYGEDAIVVVYSEVDGEYIVEVYDQNYTVAVFEGEGSTAISGLAADEDILVSVAIADGNYSAYNTTAFSVAPKDIPVVISVENIIYGEEAVVIVESDIDGEYLVYVGDEPLVVNVIDGAGNVHVSGLTVGSYAANVTIINGNYSAFNETSFEVTPKEISVIVSVEDIVYGEDAIVVVESDVGGEYIVEVYGENYTVTVSDGSGSTAISGLAVDEGILVSVSIADGNYSAYNTTTFSVAPKDMPVSISVEDITYGDSALVIVEADVDGEYLVYVGDEPFTVTVTDGAGNVSVSGLTVGNYAANVTALNGNYSEFDETSFEVAPKEISVAVSVGDIIYGEDAIAVVYGEVDGEYIVEIRNQNYTVTVSDGSGSTAISGLAVGEGISASVSIADGNYSAYNTTTFSVAPNQMSVIISVGNITYGEDAVVVVQSDVDGDYIVTIRDVNYTVSVIGGDGVTFISNLTVGNQIAATVMRDDNYTAFNETAFNINPKQADVEVAAGDITYGENATVSIVAEIDGMYTLSVNDVEYPVEVIDGEASQVISGLTAGDYVVHIAIVNGNYSASSRTAFNVAPKPVSIVVSVGDITYGEEAVVVVEAEIDGEYLVYVDGDVYTVDVADGIGDVSVGGLAAGTHVVNATPLDGNYSGVDSTTFDVAVKQIDVSVSVEDIIYGEEAVIIVESDVDGDYLVYVDDEPFVVTVADGVGNVSVSGLTVGSYAANVTALNGNYSVFNETVFEVAPKEILVVVSVEDIVYGEDAIVVVYGEVDGEYIVEICDQNYTVAVFDGEGSTAISGLEVGEGILASVSIADGNYSAYNTTTFNIVPKDISVVVSVGNITYGEDTVVVVESDVDGDYIVTIRDVDYTVSVIGGDGVTFISNLTVGNQIAVTVMRDDKYTAFNETAFNIYPKAGNVEVSAEDITYGEDVTVSIVAEIDGMYTLYVNDMEYPVEVIDGEASQVISGLNAGDYLVQVAIADGNYSAFDETVFEVAPKEILVVVSVEDIIYGEDAVVVVYGEVDGEYIVEVCNQNYTVAVFDGEGSTAISGLDIGEGILVSVSIADGNYSAYNTTTFNVAPKDISVVVSVGNITYGEDTVVVVESDVDGDYIVTIRDVNYTVSVIGGDGVTFISNLTVGNQIAVTVMRDDNYTAFNETTFNINPKPVDVEVAVENITYGENATVSIVAEIDGMYTLYVNDVEYQVEVIDGEASQVVSGLNAGDYLVQIAIVDGNYSAYNLNAFNVAPRPVFLAVSVEDITYGEELVVIVESDVDGEYLVYVDGDVYTVDVADGVGNVSVGGLAAGTHVVNVTVLDGNYSGDYSTTFDVAVMQIDVSVSVEDIIYGDEAVVIVESGVDGEYLVYVGDEPFVVTVIDGAGNVSVSDLSVGNYVVNVTALNDNYSASNETVFEVAPKEISVVVSVEDIVYGDNAIAVVYGEIDGEYIVDVCSQKYTVAVSGGKGNTAISGLAAGEGILASVSIADGNYSAYNTTTFNVASKDLPAIISVENGIYGDSVLVTVESEIDGEYLVYVDDEPFVVTVIDGAGNVSVSDLGAGSHAVNVTALNGNYSVFNETVFEIAPKAVSVAVSVGDIVYGDDAIVVVYGEIDGEYIVEIRNQNYTVNVSEGKGNTPISGLAIGEDISVSVSIANANYSAVNTTAFNIAPKEIPVIISVGNIAYGEDAVVVVESDVDGDYIVTVRDVNYTVSVNGGDGVTFIPNLGVGNQIAVTVMRDDNYTAFNETEFNINPKPVNVEVAAENITYGESATVSIIAEIDGMYTLYVNDMEYPIEVIDGKASQVISGLVAGDYLVQIAIAEGNYSAYNLTAFNVAQSDVSLGVSAEDVTYGEKAVVTVVSDVDGEYLVYVNDEFYTVNVTDGVASLELSGLEGGNYTVDVFYGGDDNHKPANSTAVFNVLEAKSSICVTMIDGLNVTGILKDKDGNGIADMEIVCMVGDEKVVVKTNDKGEFTVQVHDNILLNMTFEGSSSYAASNASIILKNIKPVQKSTKIEVPANFQRVAVDYKAGEKGTMFYVTLKDSDGNPVAKKGLKVGIFDKIYTIKTDNNGVAGLPLNVANANYYTYAITFLGDEDYKACFAVSCLEVVKKPITITPAKTSYSFTASAKTKTITATLKSSNSYIPKGKQVTLTIAGKTFKTTIGDKGQISFNVGSITAKGTYNVAIKFAGTKTYSEASSANIKVVIK